jgi:transposase
MGRFIEGADRRQATLLPDTIEDYVGEENPVRVVDAFVDALDLAGLGFNGVIPEETGRPSYHPATILKIYMELIWLTGRLTPDFKTIADFRRDNGPAIRKVCQQFIALCRGLDLLDASIVAIDGNKFKAVNAKTKSFTREKLKRRLGEIDAAIEKYLIELDRADEVVSKTGMSVPEARLARAGQETRLLQTRGQCLESDRTAHGQQRRDAGLANRYRCPRHGNDEQKAPRGRLQCAKCSRNKASSHRRSPGDEPRLRSRRFGDDGACGAGGNVLRRHRGDCRQGILQGRGDRGVRRGRYPGHRTQASNAAAHGRFDRADFTYIAGDDAYVCPAGARLTYRFTNTEAGKTLRSYWTDACGSCAIKHRCTTSKERRVRRWEHEGILERVQQRLDDDPNKMSLRCQTVEHPFGTIKRGWVPPTSR